jgi:hypothetical protein
MIWPSRTLYLAHSGTEIGREKLSGRFLESSGEAKRVKSAILPECTVSGDLWEESQVKRSSRPSRSVWHGPCRTAATWRSTTPTKGK